MSTLQADEKIVSCVACEYYEIRSDNPAIFWCGGCGTVHCTICKADLPKLTDGDLEYQDVDGSDDDDDDDDDDYFDAGSQQKELIRHLQCSPLRDEKGLFERTVAEGSGVPCPECGVIGRKDAMCTHMTCERCSTVWCYVCGLSEKDCDKSTTEGTTSPDTIYQHNTSWQTNEKRCPMYLSQILEVDDEWSDLIDEIEDEEGGYDEEELEELCLNKLHRWRTLQKLHSLRNSLGEAKWNELWYAFPSVRGCGFSDEEIANANSDVALFNRPDEEIANANSDVAL